MIKYIITFFICAVVCNVIAQQQKISNYKVGDRLFINNCHKYKPEYAGIEVYSRADLYDKSNVDSLTGVGLSKAFFNTKTLEGKPLPCSMGGKNYTIAAIDKFTEKNITHTIILLYDYYPLNILLVDYENAVLNREILLKKMKFNKKLKH